VVPALPDAPPAPIGVPPPLLLGVPPAFVAPPVIDVDPSAVVLPDSLLDEQATIHRIPKSDPRVRTFGFSMRPSFSLRLVSRR
jgi:hypothetical protein